METFNTKIKHTRGWLALAACLLFIISGCTLSGIEDEINNDVSEEDLEAASQILGESLSDDNSGIMSSLNDAVTTISDNGFVRTSPKSKSTGYNTIQDEEDNSGRGRETNITYSYDPETGTHTLTFKREINRAKFTKSVSDTLKYIFTDINGNFISAPRRQRDRVETIDYKGKRDGLIDTPRKNSTFSRQDTFLIDGISKATNILEIDGVHYGQGSMNAQNDEGNRISRSYELTINFLDIQIDKALVQENQNLEQGVTGTLSWEMYIEKQNGGGSEIKTIRGTIEMNGDGTALLRFKNFTKLFQIRLDDGDVHDQSNQFAGHVESVNIERRTFKLASGRTVKVTEDTEVDPEGDLTTFNQIATTLEEGHVVEAEGRGFKDGDIFVATRVRFETERDDDEREGGRFEAFVSDAKTDLGQIILQDERVIQITDNTEIDEDGDIHSLGGVKEALEHGYDVIADGHGFETDEEDINLIATEIRFDKKESDSEETEKVEFEDQTAEVNLEASTVTLEDGTVILVTDDTDFADDTNYESLDGVQEALANDQAVITSGKGEETEEEGIDIIATLIRFTKQN